MPQALPPRKKSNANEKHVKFAEETVVATYQTGSKIPETETQFTHLKIKKPEYVPVAEPQKEAEVDKVVEEVKSKPKTQHLDAVELNRKARKQEQRKKDLEHKRKYP